MLTEGLRVESYLTTAQPFACFQIYLRVNWKTEENRSSALSEQRRTNILMSNLSMVQAVESMKKKDENGLQIQRQNFFNSGKPYLASNIHNIRWKPRRQTAHKEKQGKKTSCRYHGNCMIQHCSLSSNWIPIKCRPTLSGTDGM